MLDCNCEFTCHIEMKDIENVREATEEDIKKFNKTFKEFVEANDLYLLKESEG